jgi:phosphonate transport system substrate-binding protein
MTITTDGRPSRRAAVRSGLAIAFALATPSQLLAATPLRLAVSDISGLDDLRRAMGPFATALATATGLDIELVGIADRTAALDAMAGGRLDLVLTGVVEYVVLRARLGAEPLVAWDRPGYGATLVVPDVSPYATLADLSGRRISFGRRGSASQHLGPMLLLADAGLAAQRDYAAVFMDLAAGVDAMFRGDLAAVGMNHTNLAKFRQRSWVRRYRALSDGIPLHDVLVAAPGVTADVRRKVRSAFVDHTAPLRTAIFSTADNRKFAGTTFRATITDGDYDVVRRMYAAAGATDLTRFIPP